MKRLSCFTMLFALGWLTLIVGLAVFAIVFGFGIWHGLPASQAARPARRTALATCAISPFLGLLWLFIVDFRVFLREEKQVPREEENK